MLFAAALVLGLAVNAPAPAQDKDKEKPGPSLKLGDKAPPIKATKWLQGEKVASFEPGKVYVVEFWATWCGPCIVMMPHMAEMQAEYKGKATIVGFTSKDPNNSEEKVVEFVKKRGPKLTYTFAYAEDTETNDAYMKASGQQGIPCSFVVDKEGKIAYIGHPMFLDLVMPKVVAGTWDVKADPAAIEKISGEVDAVFEAFGNKDPEAGLKTVAAFEAKYPPLAHVPYFVAPKISLLIKAKKYDEARKAADEAIAKAVKADDSGMLRNLSMTLRSGEAKDQKELVALSVKAAEAGLKVGGDKDAVALLFAAEAYFAAGDKAKAADLGKKAIAAAEGEPNLQKAIERRVNAMTDEKKDDKK
jgi:thiol-disulfide isomerase/thioredoxin